MRPLTEVSGPIIDCHCHAGTGDGLTGPWDTTAPIVEHQARAKACGIVHTVIFAAFNSDYAAANAQVADLVRQAPDRLTGFVFVHPARDRGRVLPMVRHFVERERFRGIKVHRHDAPITREVCDVARELRLPVLYDVTGEVAQIELFATEYPTVNFIIPHLGSFADDWRAQVAFLGFLSRHTNVYTDTSGVRRFDLLLQAVREAGAHKVLFGSDGPWLHPAVELAKVLALPLSPQDKQLVLGGNLLRLLRARRQTIAIGHDSAARTHARGSTRLLTRAPELKRTR
ncbi:amidohydrolase family protein [Gemmatimonas groenlandica]|uniref:Amidohydrolase family protein n=1 Tax=Gemmatimonas groenlandica TaxID=2732249 RepID=A0A6M4IKY6_9BACT|nr:amidohydrolase family protein [Gemmatimonas groenlandica]QJR35694.1 amidohydrolase family protein [Gemmatimonas groenlandica]